MRVVVHVGMPKAGSTAIQETLSAHRTEILRDYGIDYWQEDDEVFPNHHSLYTCLERGDLARAKEKMSAVLAHARNSGATTCFISNEMFILLAANQASLSDFRTTLGHEGEFEFLVYLRDLRHFLRSYIVQLLANGTFAIEDDGIASFYCHLIQNFYNSGTLCTILNYDTAVRRGDLAAHLVSFLSGKECSLRSRRVNITPPRPVAHYAIAGLVSRLSAITNAVHVNEEKINDLRIAMETAYDLDAGLQQGIRRYEDFLVPVLSEYIETSMRRLTLEQRAFLQAFQ